MVCNCLLESMLSAIQKIYALKIDSKTHGATLWYLVPGKSTEASASSSELIMWPVPPSRAACQPEYVER